MGNFLVVSKADKLEEYKKNAEEYGVSYEINDFFIPSLLDDEKKQEEIIQTYLKSGIPQGSTMHGAFFDVAVFSQDEKIRNVSQLRMQQSMQIAEKLGVKGVVFHTNHNPYLSSKAYKEHLIAATAEYVSELLQQYPNIEIYMENMFDTTPDILHGISKRLEQYKNFGVCLDWAHVNVYGQEKTAWIDRLGSYVKHIHINDNDLKEDLHLPIGDGVLDWEQFFEYYNRYFKNCSVLIETTEPLAQRKSLEYIKKYVDHK